MSLSSVWQRKRQLAPLSNVDHWVLTRWKRRHSHNANYTTFHIEEWFIGHGPLKYAACSQATLFNCVDLKLDALPTAVTCEYCKQLVDIVRTHLTFQRNAIVR
jgi:hypothetical protein